MGTSRSLSPIERASLASALAKSSACIEPRASTGETVNYRKSRAPAINGSEWLLETDRSREARSIRRGQQLDPHVGSEGSEGSENTRSLPVATIERVIVHRLLTSDDSRVMRNLETSDVSLVCLRAILAFRARIRLPVWPISRNVS